MILVAIAVSEDRYCEVLGAAEGMKEDKASWVSFFQWLCGHGLDGDCWGQVSRYAVCAGSSIPRGQIPAMYRYCNVCFVTSYCKLKLAAKTLKAIHSLKSKNTVREKAKTVIAELRTMKLKETGKKVEDCVWETLTG